MTVHNVLDFQVLILKSGLREKADGHLRDILDCVQFFSSMCGCNPESKDEKYRECDMRYRNFVKYSLDTVKAGLLAHEENITFLYNNEVIGQIHR